MAVLRIFGFKWRRWYTIILTTGLAVTTSLAISTMYKFDQVTKQAKLSAEIITALDRLELSMVDAETGQRGFIITADEGYLDVYKAGIVRFQKQLTDLLVITENNAVQDRIRDIASVATPKFAEMALTLVQRQKSFEAARDEVDTHLGKNLMMAFRAKADNLIADQQRRINQLEDRAETLAHWATVCLIGSIISFVLALFVGRHLITYATEMTVTSRWRDETTGNG